MARSDPLEVETPLRHRPVPQDVARAVRFMRQNMGRNMGRKISMADVAAYSGVAARTLRKHFYAFMGTSVFGYWWRLRLTAAREHLLKSSGKASVTAIALRFGFDHFGRFSQHYRRAFGETPSATLRRSRLAELGRTGRTGDDASTDCDAFALGGCPWREKPSVAILPCAAGSEHRVFGECLSDSIGIGLARARSLTVVLPRWPKGIGSYDPARLSLESGARYFVIGRILQADKGMRIIVRLVATATGTQIWGDSFDGDASDLLHLQDRVTEGVVGAIMPAIRGAEIERARHKRPQDLTAYDLAMRALPFVFASNPNASGQALDLLDRALEIAPDYGFATALAGLCHAQLAVHNGTEAPSEEKLRALLMAERAAILDPDDSQVLIARCAVHTIAGQFDVAGSLIERALAIEPSAAWAWERSGWLKTFAGEPEMGLAHLRRAIRLDPLSPSNANRLVGLGCAHFDLGRYEQAAFWMRKALRERPSTAWVNRTLSVSYARLGERRAALDSLKALQRYSPDLTIRQVMASLPFPQDFMGRVAEGLDHLGLPA